MTGLGKQIFTVAGRTRVAWALLVLALASPLQGCGHAPLRPEAGEEPALHAIRAAFARTLDNARDDTSITWESGWLGNASINLLGGNRRGLCYQWRNLVYDGVIDTVHEVGWDATGVVISKGTYSEHSAVLVFDPRRVAPDAVLSAASTQPVYILDAWRRGEADIYTLHDWLALPIIVRSPAQIKPLPVEAPAQPVSPTS